MAKRRFTNTEWDGDTQHNKFWEVEVVPGKVEGYDMIKSWGKIGAVPISQTKHFRNQYAADTEARKMIDQKLAKGYVEQRIAQAPPQRTTTAAPLRTTESEAVAASTLNLSQRSARTMAPPQPAVRPLCASCHKNPAASGSTTNLCGPCILGKKQPQPEKKEEEKTDRFQLIELD